MDRTVFATAAGMLLAGCGAPPPPSAPPTPAAELAACEHVSGSDWAAWINAMPGPGARPTLIVTGKVTVPTGGYRIEWRDFRVAESYPVQVFGELRVIPPPHGAIEVVVTHDVRGEWPLAEPVGSVTISCGDRVLARISPVETAQ